MNDSTAGMGRVLWQIGCVVPVTLGCLMQGMWMCGANTQLEIGTVWDLVVCGISMGWNLEGCGTRRHAADVCRASPILVHTSAWYMLSAVTHGNAHGKHAPPRHHTHKLLSSLDSRQASGLSMLYI